MSLCACPYYIYKINDNESSKGDIKEENKGQAYPAY